MMFLQNHFYPIGYFNIFVADGYALLCFKKQFCIIFFSCCLI